MDQEKKETAFFGKNEQPATTVHHPRVSQIRVSSDRRSLPVIEQDTLQGFFYKEP